MRSFLRRLLAPVSQTMPLPTRRDRLVLDSPPPVLYAVGDVHGCFDALLDAEARIRADAGRRHATATVIYLGDYVDRGPHSRRVIDHLSQPAPGDMLNRIMLCGNHDDTFLRFIRDQATSMSWLDFGGDTTLLSYGIDPGYLIRQAGDLSALKAAMKEAIPAQHIAFLESLPICLVAGRHLFVHAGVQPGIALNDQSDDDLMWIREPFLSSGPGLDLTVIHGHTRSVAPDFGRGRIGIDTGCYATGRLTVLKVEVDGERTLVL